MIKKILIILMGLTILISFVGADSTKVIIYAPATPSSIPIIIAANNMPNTEIKIFTNHSQANALFLKDDIQILSTGLSVGMSFFDQGIPVQIVNSYVAGLTNLVTYGKKVGSFSDLKGKKLAIPFEGSPIEEIINYFCLKENINLKKDIEVTYLPFQSSVELLKKGEIFAVALPEPFVSQVKNQPNIFVSLSFHELWNEYTQSKNGYPQVGTFVKKFWAENNKEFISNFNMEIVKAIQYIAKTPDKAITDVSSYFVFPLPILTSALNNTSFNMATNTALENLIYQYYSLIGKPLNENYKNFFFKYSK